MRLSNTTKYLVLGNDQLKKYCKEVGISDKKLSQCNIEKMGGNYVFTLAKINIPKSKSIIPLDVDIETQPDIVLIMTVNDDTQGISFQTTKDSIRVLNT